jgi:hypothetical protein
MDAKCSSVKHLLSEQEPLNRIYREFGEREKNIHFSKDFSAMKPVDLVCDSCNNKDVLISHMSLGSDVIWQTDNPYSNIEISPENFDYLSIEEHLRVRWGDTHGGFRCFASKRQRALYTLLITYSNIFYPLITYQTFPYEIHEITDVCLLHILNHCSKSRKNIKENTTTTTLKNNKCLKGDIPKDRGFVQAKVLIIVPMKNRAWALVNRLVQLAIKENHSNFVQRREIFEQEIGTHEMQHDNNKERKYPNTHTGHPPIFEGNIDDNFGFGITIKKYF